MVVLAGLTMTVVPATVTTSTLVDSTLTRRVVETVGVTVSRYVVTTGSAIQEWAEECCYTSVQSEAMEGGAIFVEIEEKAVVSIETSEDAMVSIEISEDPLFPSNIRMMQ